MEKLSLSAEVRNTEEKLSEIRTNKMVPGVVYGHSQEPIALKVDNSSFLKTFRKSGESHIINLTVGKKKMDVLVHEIQRNPVTEDFIHIDFYALTKGEAVHTKIHLNFIGSAPAAKEGALIEEHIKEIELKCQAADLVDGFDVDLSTLENIGDSIRVSDLNIDSKKYDVLTGSDDLIVIASKMAKIEIEPEVAAEEETTEETTEEEK